jgi:hypothetical protein
MTAPKKTVAVVEDKNTAMALHAARPAFAGTGRGSEQVAVDDLTIPRIGIVQDLSPERKRNDANYIEGAEEGMMFNSVTRKLYPGSILVIPVYYRKEFFLWKPRKEGGGFRGVYPSMDQAMRAQASLDENVDIKDTGQQFVLVSDDDGVTWSEAVLSMSGSNMTVSKKWNADLRLKECDRFATVYEVSAIQKTNSQGTFYVYKIVWKGWAQEAWYKQAEQTYEAIAAGLKDVVRDEGDFEPETTSEQGDLF